MNAISLSTDIRWPDRARERCTNLPRGKVRRMTPPSTTARHAQDQIDTRAIEIAQRADSRIDGHELLCSERFKNLAGKVDELKSGQDRLEGKLDSLGTARAIDAGKRDGAHLLGMTIKDWLMVAIAAAVLVSNFMMKH